MRPEQLPEITNKLLLQLQTDIEPLLELRSRLMDLPEVKSVLQKMLESTLPKLTPENARTLERMAFRISAGLPPVAEKAVSISEFKGSLSRSTRTKFTVEDINRILRDET